MAGVRSGQGEASREQLMQYLREFYREHKYMPSIADMVRATGHRRVTVQWHLEKLREDNKVRYEDGNMARSLRLR